MVCDTANIITSCILGSLVFCSLKSQDWGGASILHENSAWIYLVPIYWIESVPNVAVVNAVVNWPKVGKIRGRSMDRISSVGERLLKIAWSMTLLCTMAQNDWWGRWCKLNQLLWSKKNTHKMKIKLVHFFICYFCFVFSFKDTRRWEYTCPHRVFCMFTNSINSYFKKSNPFFQFEHISLLLFYITPDDITYPQLLLDIETTSHLQFWKLTSNLVYIPHYDEQIEYMSRSLLLTAYESFGVTTVMCFVLVCLYVYTSTTNCTTTVSRWFSFPSLYHSDWQYEDYYQTTGVVNLWWMKNTTATKQAVELVSSCLQFTTPDLAEAL